MRTNNLKPWLPGQSGNPGGRPKKSAVTDHLREQLERPIPPEMLAAMKPAARAVFFSVYGEQPTFGEMLAFKLVQQSAKGDVFAMKELLDRVEGKVTQKTVLAGDGEQPLAFTVTRVGVKG